MAVSYSRLLIDSSNTEDVSALRPHARPRIWTLRIHYGGTCVYTEEQRRGPQSVADLKRRNPNISEQPLISAADNEKHLSDAMVREHPDAGWNASRFVVSHVKPSVHSLQWV